VPIFFVRTKKTGKKKSALGDLLAGRQAFAQSFTVGLNSLSLSSVEHFEQISLSASVKLFAHRRLKGDTAKETTKSRTLDS